MCEDFSHFKGFLHHFLLAKSITSSIKEKPCFTHTCLQVPLEIFIWIYDTFDNNFEIKNKSTNYFKGSC